MATALDHAFADLDSQTARLDWKLMSEVERSEVSDKLRLRLIQFTIFLKAIHGNEELQRRLEEAFAFPNVQ